MSCCQAARIARSGRPCRQRRGAPLADLPNFPLALLTSHVALQVWELYNSVQQTQARTHPGILGTQKALLGLFHTSSAESPVSVRTPISYYDRLRIRFPGDSVFALGEHIDGGSLERWEDPGESFGDAVSVMTLDWTADESATSMAVLCTSRTGFRSCWSEIFAGGPDPHVRHDPYDLTPRLEAKTSLYPSSGQCSVFRMFQGAPQCPMRSLARFTSGSRADIGAALRRLDRPLQHRPRRGHPPRLP